MAARIKTGTTLAYNVINFIAIKHKSGGICMGIHYTHSAGVTPRRSNDNNGIVIVGTPYYIHLILGCRSGSLLFILVRAAWLY